MSTTPDTTKPKRRLGRTIAAAAAALAVTAAPAAATVAMQNMVEANIKTTTACMAKIAGGDTSSTSGLVSFNTTATQTTTDGVAMLNELFTVTAVKGDRLVSSDAGAVKNNCTYSLVVTVRVEDQFGDPKWAGPWTDLAATLYLGKANGAADPTFGATDWLGSPVKANSTGVVDDIVGTVTLAPGESARLGWAVDCGTGATATAGNPAILRFTVQGEPV